MATRFNLAGVVQYNRVALNLSDIEKYRLPTDPFAIKKSDTRYKKFAARYGDTAVELDALHPGELERLAREAIESELDMNLFEEQRGVERMEQKRVFALRRKVMALIKNELGVV